MYRLLLHVPVGLACAAIATVCWPISLLLGLFFLSYETNQDRHKKDDAFKDIEGAAWGLAIGGIAILVFDRLKRSNLD
jgi:hypothetical protein